MPFNRQHQHHQARRIIDQARRQLARIIADNIKRAWELTSDFGEPDFDRGERYVVDTSGSAIHTLIPKGVNDKASIYELSTAVMDKDGKITLRFADPTDLDVFHDIVIDNGAPGDDLNTDLLANIANYFENYTI